MVAYGPDILLLLLSERCHSLCLELEGGKFSCRLSFYCRFRNMHYPPLQIYVQLLLLSHLNGDITLIKSC